MAMELSDEDLDSLPRMRAREPLAVRPERLLSLSEELRVAYALCHSLRVLHRAGKAGWWDGMPGELSKWCLLGITSRIPEVVACARTVKRNREGILNSYRYGRTNAVAEGVNNSIKVTKRRGYGIRTFAAFRRRILLAMGIGRAEVVRLSICDVAASD